MSDLKETCQLQFQIARKAAAPGGPLKYGPCYRLLQDDTLARGLGAGSVSLHFELLTKRSSPSPEVVSFFTSHLSSTTLSLHAAHTLFRSHSTALSFDLCRTPIRLTAYGHSLPSARAFFQRGDLRSGTPSTHNSFKLHSFNHDFFNPHSFNPHSFHPHQTRSRASHPPPTNNQ